MREELTEAVVWRRSEKRRSRKPTQPTEKHSRQSLPINREAFLQLYLKWRPQHRHPPANPSKSLKTPPLLTECTRWLLPKQMDDLIKKIYET